MFVFFQAIFTCFLPIITIVNTTILKIIYYLKTRHTQPTVLSTEMRCDKFILNLYSATLVCSVDNIKVHELYFGIENPLLESGNERFHNNHNC